jgi:hypothetical protein
MAEVKAKTLSYKYMDMVAKSAAMTSIPSQIAYGGCQKTCHAILTMAASMATI